MIKIIENDWSWDDSKELARLNEAKAIASASKENWSKFSDAVLEMPPYRFWEPGHKPRSDQGK